MMLDTATDVGFLLVDAAHREVLFEGDHERIRIPVGAILSCKVEQTIIGDPSLEGMKYYFTVIRARHASGPRELPFAYRGDLGTLARRPGTTAVALRDRIRGLAVNCAPGTGGHVNA
jgi:hypothetical protein